MALNIDINDISETAFLTLQCHAIDAQSATPILNDRSSVNTLNVLKDYFSESKSALHKKLFQNKVRPSLVTYTVLRARKYDRYITKFMEKYPDAAIVNIGCGLDHRFERVNNGSISFFDLDLPDIMNIKKQLFQEQANYNQISQSVFDLDWIEKIEAEHVMLVAEGVFMYCDERDVKRLFMALQEKLNNPEIVFEVFSAKWLTGWRKKLMDFKLKKELKLGAGTSFKFGIPDSDAIVHWSPGFRLVDDWSYLDSDELNTGLMRFFSRNDALRKVQWTVHYALNKIE
ncbi:class I SAM-dependent methyltransferase [Fulvivirgaceae bacterium BMA12]|uniref:Class I SAM-dependent methyltransferase n=1 Tax=Agaribacillus aureus TaxID=3051825 RepID=A0ABT8LCF8_9BACT|nr:class I SAM-dependent methyltransferase [Fulvivirgaceae bacterium BMA12]